MTFSRNENSCYYTLQSYFLYFFDRFSLISMENGCLRTLVQCDSTAMTRWCNSRHVLGGRPFWELPSLRIAHKVVHRWSAGRKCPGPKPCPDFPSRILYRTHRFHSKKVNRSDHHIFYLGKRTSWESKFALEIDSLVNLIVLQWIG